MRKTAAFVTAGLVASLVVLNIGCNEAAKGDPAVKPGLDSAQMVKRGEYIVSVIGCDDCHSPKKMGPHGPELDMELRFSGYPASRPLTSFDTNTVKSWYLFGQDLTTAVGPWGQSFAGNITSDATGIGSWTEEQFVRCLREGKWKGLPDARPLMPPMPWQNFAKLTDEDLRSVYKFLKTTKPVNNTVPAWIPPGAKPAKAK